MPPKISKEITLTLPVSTLEELRCSMCHGYLSCSPVRLLSNGNCICGRCSPLNVDSPIYRLVAFEAVLRRMSFPCVFEKYGCSETLLFGGTADHESNCLYKPFACPVNPNCSWEGGASQLSQHFKNEHKGILKDKVKFRLNLDCNARDILVVAENLLVFTVKYVYSANERIFKYDVRFCANQDGFGASSQLQLINGSDFNCSVNLKASECCAFDETFYSMQNATVLNLNKFLEALSDPDSVKVALKLSVVKPHDRNVPFNKIPQVNFKSIESLRCNTCPNYLIPPLFDLNGKTICCACGKNNSNCSPSNKTKLLRRVNDTAFPCRWEECKFTGKGNIYKKHVLKCKFRLYHCVYLNCNITFKLPTAVAHLLTHTKEYIYTHHDIVFMPANITYKTSFTQHSACHDILTIKNNRLILIIHKVINSKLFYEHCIEIYPSRDDFDDVRGTVEFEHEQMLLKSRQFNIISNLGLKVTLQDLPSCFKETNSVRIYINVIA